MLFDNFTTKRVENKEDFLLVERILNGEERALLEFYKRFNGKIFSYLKRKIANISDAEEILQDVMLSSIEALRDYTGRSSLSTYIYSIASHKTIDYYRKRKINQVLFSSLPELGDLFSNLLGPEEEFEEKLFKERIEKTLARLKPDYRKVLTFKYIYGMSVSEIAEKISGTIKTVESRLFRARKAFTKIYIE